MECRETDDGHANLYFVVRLFGIRLVLLQQRVRLVVRNLGQEV